MTLNPVRIHLSAAVPGQSLTIHNDSEEATRFQITQFVWRQDTDGEMLLSPASNLAIYPTLFQVKAGQTRRIRITSTEPYSELERSYRIFVEELPALIRQNDRAIVMLKRFGIPIFLQPKIPVARPRLSAHVTKRELSVILENSGNSYFQTKSVVVEGRSSNGTVLFEKELSGWYVLAASERRYQLPLTPNTCQKLALVKVKARTDQGEVSIDEAVPPGACGDS